jgi:hypothetical protein
MCTPAPMLRGLERPISLAEGGIRVAKPVLITPRSEQRQRQSISACSLPFFLRRLDPPRPRGSGEPVARINHATSSRPPQNARWMWILAPGQHGDRTPTHGYARPRWPRLPRAGVARRGDHNCRLFAVANSGIWKRCWKTRHFGSQSRLPSRGSWPSPLASREARTKTACRYRAVPPSLREA